MKRILENIGTVIIGKRDVIRQAVIALLCRGHLLIEDVPGLGKTLLAKALSASVGGEFKRIQFTPDLLPSDVTGCSIFDPRTNEFTFRPGPVFTHVLLADEINRGTPRTQSSLLECMEERQVTQDGTTRVLEEPFFVVATQNPVELQGTYPLPEAQLDRFFMKIHIGYPESEEEEQIARLPGNSGINLNAVCEIPEMLKMQKQIPGIHMDPSLVRYATTLVRKTREHNDVQLGASPRGAQALCRAAQAAAYLDSSDFVRPDHVKSLALPVLRHRLILKPQARLTGILPDQVIMEILDGLEVPVS